MWRFRRIDPAVSILNAKCVALVGSGGKTSLMEHLARECLARGRTVAITTTTRIYATRPYVLLDGNEFEGKWKDRFVRVGRTCKEGKLTGLSFADLEQLSALYDLVLVEADGARRMPLKFPAVHDPVVPPFSDMIFVVCGLDALQNRVDEKVFRWRSFSQATGIPGDAAITPDLLLRFFAPDILFKAVDVGRAIPVLNKCDATTMREEVRRVAEGIIARTGCKEALISSVLLKVFYSISRF